MSAMIHSESTGKVLLMRGSLFQRPLLFHILLQSSASNQADETPSPLICHCVGPPECKWRCKGMMGEDVLHAGWQNSRNFQWIPWFSRSPVWKILDFLLIYSWIFQRGFLENQGICWTLLYFFSPNCMHTWIQGKLAEFAAYEVGEFQGVDRGLHTQLCPWWGVYSSTCLCSCSSFLRPVQAL